MLIFNPYSNLKLQFVLLMKFSCHSKPFFIFFALIKSKIKIIKQNRVKGFLICDEIEKHLNNNFLLRTTWKLLLNSAQTEGLKMINDFYKQIMRSLLRHEK